MDLEGTKKTWWKNLEILTEWKEIKTQQEIEVYLGDTQLILVAYQLLRTGSEDKARVNGGSCGIQYPEKAEAC